LISFSLTSYRKSIALPEEAMDLTIAWMMAAKLLRIQNVYEHRTVFAL
jgi:hypothetical protein